jgi:transposase
MGCCPDGKAYRRLNAIHLLMIGVSYEHVLHNSCVGERTLRLWISRFNEAGIDGLTYRPRCGRPRLIEPGQVASEILPLVDDPSLAGETHWTLTKLCGWLREEKEMDLSYRTLVRYLHEQRYARRIPRPVPEPPDREAWEDRREAFAMELLDYLEDDSCEVFFGDEAGFEGDPRPRQKWVKRGSRPTQGYYGGHIRQNVVGAVNPASGELVSLIVSHCDTEVFQAFLDTMAGEVPQQRGRRVLLVLDNAGWHKTKRLRWHHIQPVYLPPYSPDFNPIERLWQHLKGHHLAGFLTKCREELRDKLTESIRDLLTRPDLLRSVCRTHSP